MPPTQRFEQPMQWLSRTIAVLIFMVGPGIVGSMIDRWLKLSIFTPIGFGIGIALATVVLLVLAKHFVPAAQGKPMRDAEESGDLEEVEPAIDKSAPPDRFTKDHRR